MERTHEHAGAHERLFWRRAAHWGSTRPDWFMRAAAPIAGYVTAAFVPDARRAVLSNLERVRGPASPVQNTRDMLATFATFASCIAEVLSNARPEGPRKPDALIVGERHVKAALVQKKGLLLVTAHTAGWDVVGPLLGKTYGLDLILVTHAEPDARAGEIQDAARKRSGVEIARVGDALSSLPLLRHLQKNGVVALQLDRVVPGMKTRAVTLLGAPGELPEGPFRLAQLSGAPILPIFCGRRGHRQYVVEAFEPRNIARRAGEAELDEAANHVADCMSRFLRAHPTQWFQFGGG